MRNLPSHILRQCPKVLTGALAPLDGDRARGGRVLESQLSATRGIPADGRCEFAARD